MYRVETDLKGFWMIKRKSLRDIKGFQSYATMHKFCAC